MTQSTYKKPADCKDDSPPIATWAEAFAADLKRAAEKMRDGTHDKHIDTQKDDD